MRPLVPQRDPGVFRVPFARRQPVNLYRERDRESRERQAREHWQSLLRNRTLLLNPAVGQDSESKGDQEQVRWDVQIKVEERMNHVGGHGRKSARIESHAI